MIPNEERREKGVSSGMLFLIGLSGGFISAVFPRLITFLTVSSERTQIFSKDFLVVAVCFGIIIGISMYWLYLDTKEKESAKNLFMAALALPSILSGGMNMANSTQAGQNQIHELSSKNRILEQRLSEALNIPTLPSVTFEGPQHLSHNTKEAPHWLGLSSAHAALELVENSPDQQFNPGIKFNVPEERRDHIIVLDIVGTEEEANNKLIAYQSQTRLLDVAIRQSKNQYYIVLATPLSRSDALVRADEIKKEYQLAPKLLKVK